MYDGNTKIDSDEALVAEIGDVHIGSLNAKKRAFEKSIDWCNDNDAYVILMGDLIDAITPNDIRYDSSNMDRELLTMTEQFDYLEEQLGRIENNHLLGMIVGNHYGKWAIRACTDEKARMSKRLGCEFYGLRASIDLELKGQTFRISAWHGAGGGYQKGGVMNKMAGQPAAFDADVFVQGHSHQLFHFYDIIYGRAKDEEDRQQPKLFANTGSFLATYQEGTGGYGEAKGYKPQTLGFSAIKFRVGELPCANDMRWYKGKFHAEDLGLSRPKANVWEMLEDMSREEKLKAISLLSESLF